MALDNLANRCTLMHSGAKEGTIGIMSDLSTNLRLLCGYRPSISSVARDLGLNRSQLNRYLAGSSTPRAALLRRICDYFGVEEHEVRLPPNDFSAIVKVRGLSSDSLSRTLRVHFDRITTRNDPRIFQLSGTFFEYYWSMSTPGKVVRALVGFAPEGEHLFYRRLERMGDPKAVVTRHFRYQGAALMTGDRVFMNDYETGAGIEVTQTVLYPDYSFRWRALHGVKVGVSANRDHVPCAVRTYLERTPPRANLIANLRRVGLLTPDDPDLPEQILPMIDNRTSGPYGFQAHNLLAI
ncbi:MAG: helix-turn-helix transcriptional regulator [Rhodobacteraceae bacterium]|uniref:helix-turn-helix domain-containing protein n=1 Tax=Albidovulum sp. TaxID=1872424 RepID=UPI001D440AD6|nr:helix-turn-helix transcriptional regulator [Paracoccaceae bacterium]MCC0046581.1 helix-turn-helix transcriptional regulator [Defluviimonas sp.]HPE25178.1 helix-turn-helix transcriptional regulator [Albidovulum sp.]MCB2143744.1 helix-turn-helix transcriptional regulator [Paracoccaceae bacterium]MCB2150565.1 helix-turn-helix transcriptional regulator [Paracoccaceae bacterium]